MLMPCVTRLPTPFSVPQLREHRPALSRHGPSLEGSVEYRTTSGWNRIVRGYGFVVENLDVTLIAERPRIDPYIIQMRAELARATGLETPRVSVKGKTNDGVGALGRGEAIAAQAIALLRRVGPD